MSDIYVITSYSGPFKNHESEKGGGARFRTMWYIHTPGLAEWCAQYGLARERTVLTIPAVGTVRCKLEFLPWSLDGKNLDIGYIRMSHNMALLFDLRMKLSAYLTEDDFRACRQLQLAEDAQCPPTDITDF